MADATKNDEEDKDTVVAEVGESSTASGAVVDLIDDGDDDELEVDSEQNPLIIRKSQDGEPEAPAKGGALAAGGAVNIWSMEYFGYLPQYFVVGIIYGGLPSTTYGFFLG